MLRAAPGVTIQMHDAPEPHALSLDLVSVPPSERRQGLGTAALSALNFFADQHGVTVYLTADSGLGTPLPVLHRLYAAHGYRTAPATAAHSHVRYPGGLTASGPRR